MIKRIGLLTSGGDCQALNATMRGVVKGLANALDELEVYGFDNGYVQRLQRHPYAGRNDPGYFPAALQTDAGAG